MKIPSITNFRIGAKNMMLVKMASQKNSVLAREIVQLKGPPGFNGHRGSTGETNETVTIVHYDIPSFTVTSAGSPNYVAFNGGSVNVTNNDTQSIITANSQSFNVGLGESIIADFYVTLTCSVGDSLVEVNSGTIPDNISTVYEKNVGMSFDIPDGETRHYNARYINNASVSDSFGNIYFVVTGADCDVKVDVVVIDTKSVP